SFSRDWSSDVCSSDLHRSENRSLLLPCERSETSASDGPLHQRSKHGCLLRFPRLSRDLNRSFVSLLLSNCCRANTAAQQLFLPCSGLKHAFAGNLRGLSELG